MNKEGLEIRARVLEDCFDSREESSLSLDSISLLRRGSRSVIREKRGRGKIDYVERESR